MKTESIMIIATHKYQNKLADNKNIACILHINVLFIDYT